MRLPDPRPRRAEAPNGLAAAARASGRFPALPENADRELPRPPREVAFLIREPERRSGALTVRISNERGQEVDWGQLLGLRLEQSRLQAGGHAGAAELAEGGLQFDEVHVGISSWVLWAMTSR